ncbi:MAG: response regulator transcription factor [Bacillota bacterium]
MRQPVILVIEDDHHIRELLKVCLEQEGYQVKTEENGRQGLERALQGGCDLIVLDLMLPGMDGLSICRELSLKANTVPILMLTAKGDEVDRVLGLKMGADDYVVKPFSPRELAARVEAILRRVGKRSPQTARLAFSELKIYPDQRSADVNGLKVTFTPKEFDLLYLLAGHPGRVFTREELLNQVWGFQYLGGSRTVDEHIKNLRQKLKEAGVRQSCLQTVWGVGYKFEELA